MTTDDHIRHRVKGAETDETEFTDSDMHYAPDQAAGDLMVADSDSRWMRLPQAVNPTQLMASGVDGPIWYDGASVITRDLWLGDGVRLYWGNDKDGHIGFDSSTGMMDVELGGSGNTVIVPALFSQTQQTPGAYWTSGSERHYQYPTDSGLNIPSTEQIWMFVVKAPDPVSAIPSGRRLLNFGADDTLNDQVFISGLVPTSVLLGLELIEAPSTGSIVAPDYAWQDRNKHMTLHDVNNPAPSLPHFDFDSGDSELTIYDAQGEDDSEDENYHNFVLTLMRDANNNLLVMGSDARRRNAYAYNYTLEICRLTIPGISSGVNIAAPITQAAYDALTTKDPTTYYFITA